ncbi:hypothetical protein [Streptomyces sp. NPDC127084]
MWTLAATGWTEGSAAAGSANARPPITRYEKLVVRYEATVPVAAINEWL